MRIAVLSDPHFAGREEQARRGWEGRAIRRAWLRGLARVYRRFFWLADPTAHNHQLEAFIAAVGRPDIVVANGDYSCDSAFVGVSDEAAGQSAGECLGRLREAFGDRLLATVGDHELGKMSLFGGAGGLRWSSWERCVGQLGLAPSWSVEAAGFRLIGVTSTVIALPAFVPEIASGEEGAWEALRASYLETLDAVFAGVREGEPIILFCHDPTALPFLARQDAVRRRLGQVVCTVIGHLHSELVLRTSRWLAGMPEIGFLGNTARRLSGALRKARGWRGFRVVLCPSLAGIQLLKDGGYLELELGCAQRGEVRIVRRRLPWH